jgi:hypothetical protein
VRPDRDFRANTAEPNDQQRLALELRCETGYFLMIWSRFLMGGGGLALGLVFGGLAIALPAPHDTRRG